MAKKNNKWMQTAVKKPGAYKNWVKSVERKHRVKILNEDGTIPADFSRRICHSEKNEITWHGRKISFTDLTKRRACLALAYREAKHKKKSKKKTSRKKKKR